MMILPLRFESASRSHAIDVMVAATALARMRGLLARPPLRRGQGMLIKPCNMIHTVGMGYPIDVVFLRRDGLVLKVAHQVMRLALPRLPRVPAEPDADPVAVAPDV